MIMPTALLVPQGSVYIEVEPLTPLAFSPFGTVITCPLPASQLRIPESSSLPPPLYPSQQPRPVFANQSTALNYSPISPLTNNYHSAPSHDPGEVRVSMFCCFPRELNRGGAFDVRILERHPFTTQTFTPLGLPENESETKFLVIVAPSLPHPPPPGTSSTSSVSIHNLPDLGNVQAFMAHGGQAVTYDVGTWHAPMVVLGKRRVDFVVTQYVNGVSEEDCQEVGIEKGVVVRIEADWTRAKL